MELKNFFAQDDQGNHAPGATCYLYLRGTRTVAPGAVKANGVALPSPFYADNKGLVQLAAPDGIYDIRVITATGRDTTIQLQFNDVGESVANALSAAQRAEDARDAAQLTSGVYDDTAEGLRLTPVGRYFSVPSAIADEFLILYKNNAGVAVEIKRYSAADLKQRVVQLENKTQDLEASTAGGPFLGIADPAGNAPALLHPDGTMEIPQLRVHNVEQVKHGLEALYPFAVGDGLGYAPIWGDQDGNIFIPKLVLPEYLRSEWKVIRLGYDDPVVHIGDSYTASHYVLQDKAYISQLSALSPYRHINFGVSGNDLLDMQYRIINGTASTGQKFADMKAKYAFICSLTNDAQFRQVDQSYYAENVARLIDTVRAYGTQPVICSQFPATAIENAMLARVAEENDCHFIDCASHAAEVGGLQLGPFHQGHPGTRTGGVFWLPMLNFIDRMPKPERAIKIYRRRATWAVSTIADLLYKDRIDRHARWKELSLFHYSLNPEEKFEELNQLGSFSYFIRQDEYQQIAAGSPVAFTDYGLVEITLPGDAGSLDAVELDITATGAPTVYVRDFLDSEASMPGKIQGSSPTNATYLAKWNKPRGAWRALGALGSTVQLSAADLSRSMTGNTLVVMVAGAFSISGLEVRYKGRERRARLAPRAERSRIGDNLVTQPLCGTAAQLAGWTTTGSPSVLVPIDGYNAPRKPGTNTPVDGVCVITADDTVAQTVSLPSDNTRARRYQIEVMARYFPKAYFDASLYPGLDPEQIIDRKTSSLPAPITKDTSDLRRLKCEMWTGETYPTAGGAEYQDFAALQWRPVVFEFDAMPYRTTDKLTFRLSCVDGEIQIGKVQFWEVQK